MSNNSIGSFLAALRKANGMTQKQLAEKLNVSDKAISRWERDECAPDLSLIPVLAELYGVTSDEILRGQRADPAAAPTPQSEAKTQKRLQYLLNQVKTSYQTRSLISCMIAAIGLIAAMICDLGFNRAYLGFLCGSIFFVAALICQTIYLVQSKAALQNEDFAPDVVLECKKQMLRLSELIYSIIAVLFAFTIPLMTVPDAYWGMTLSDWLGEGFSLALVAVSLCMIICSAINNRLYPKLRTEDELMLLKLTRKLNLFQIGALLIAAVLYVTAPFLEIHPYQESFAHTVMFIASTALILFNIIFFIVFISRNKTHRKGLLLPGIRNIFLCIPTILTIQIHSSTWYRSNTELGFRRESLWQYEYITISLLTAALIFAIFGILRHFLNKRRK